MSFTLYNYVLSGNCYKVRLLASLLDVKYESVSVDFHPGQEHKSEPLLRLNPAGTLPILVINQSSNNGSSNGAGNDAGTGNDTVLTETQAMLVWLAQHHDSTNRWWPADDKNKIPLVMQWLGFASRLSATVGELRLHSMLNKTINVPAAKAGSKNASQLAACHSQPAGFCHHPRHLRVTRIAQPRESNCPRQRRVRVNYR